MNASPERARSRRAAKLPAQVVDGLGVVDYTAAGHAHADLSSAAMSLEIVLGRDDLSPAQRRDLTAALRATRRASRAVSRHLDDDAQGQQRQRGDA